MVAELRSESDSGSDEPAGKEKKGGLLRDTVIVLLTALLLSVVTRTFLVQAFYVPSGSMLPTLQLEDRILASKITGSGVQRGDVVVFSDPGGWLPPAPAESGLTGDVRTLLTWIGLLPSDADDNLVKRVIGLGGDHVACCDKQGRIDVNGTPLDEPYLAPGGTDQVRFDIVVPPGRMFVMGDNRAHSEDSRFHLDEDEGTVPLADVVGPVIAVVWPVGHWQRFSPPPTFAQVPAAAPPAAAEPPEPAASPGPGSG
jgi:signal peptidase I